MPSVQRRVTPRGEIRFRAMVRVKGHKTKTATFLKRTDAVIWAQETETRLRQSQYFPDRTAASEKKSSVIFWTEPGARFFLEKETKNRPDSLRGGRISSENTG